MGGSRQSFLVSLYLLNKADGSCHFSNPLWSKDLEHQEERRSCNQGRKQASFAGTRPRRSRRILIMKRRARLERRHSVRPANQLEKKLRILKKLIPNCRESGSVGLDNLIRETADYIFALQLRVKVMQIMVNALSGSDD